MAGAQPWPFFVMEEESRFHQNGYSGRSGSGDGRTQASIIIRVIDEARARLLRPGQDRLSRY
jgi:hypothetical protein